MADHDETLGKLIEGEAHRDAIHVAIAPVASDELLYPGQHVGLIDGSTDKVSSKAGRMIGVVDPFYQGPIYPGRRFWLALYPRTITSLRHEWTHPAFEAVANTRGESEAWMRSFSERTGLSYAMVMEYANDFLDTGDRFIQSGSEAARNAVYDVGSEVFWKHFEAITGRKADDVQRESSPYCCSC
jgi:hypothetical protein